ncbi:MAG: SMP-30/gluconolactonase/LRE family protein [Anaerolineaceae bacterium]|nr:SMP-30/gluconolactonase/LRE family protein [Anaerolineaceae bacterium]
MFKSNTSRYLRAISASVALLVATSNTPALAADLEVVATGLHFPEGVIFVGNTLYFVDYASSDVLRIAHGKVEQVWHQAGCGANGLAEVRGEILVACYDSGTIVGITSDGKFVETIDHDEANGGFVHPNDLAVDSAGGVYFSGSGDASTPGKIYYLGPSGHVNMVASGISYANGLVVSNDGKILYVAESEKDRLITFEIAAGGRLSGEAEFAKLDDILADGQHSAFIPDGVRIDKHGRLFVGLYEGGGFAVLSGQGQLIKKVNLPSAHHSNLAIAPDGKSIFVTTADDTLDGSYRGEMFKVDNPVSE